MIDKKYLIKLLLTAILLIGLQPVFGQIAPGLWVKFDTVGYTSLQLRNCKAEVVVIGKKAITSLEMEFFNPSYQSSPGEFVFPVLRGSRIKRFAVAVDLVLRDAILTKTAHSVSSSEGFLSAMPKNDPVQGEVFYYTISNIPSNGSKKVLISYEQDMKEQAGNLVYEMPWQYSPPLEEFSLVFSGATHLPVVTSSAYLPMIFEQENGSYQSVFHKTNFSPQTFQCLIPLRKEAVYAGRSRHNGKYYFYGEMQPDLPAFKKTAPKKIVLLWDVSLSARHKQIDREIELLDAYFTKLYTAELQIVTFNNELRSQRKFQVQNGNWREAKEFLADLNYDGATQIGVLNLGKYEADEFILSSDGISDFGKSELIPGRAPVICLNSQPHANTAYLQHLASQSAGQYIDLNTTDKTAALRLLNTQPYQFISAEYNSSEISEVYPSVAVNISQDFAFSGRLLKDKAKIKLNFGCNKQVKHSREIEISRIANSTGYHIEYLWADMQLQELMLTPPSDPQAIAVLSQKYNLPVPGMSWFVPESLEQYLAIGAEPPQEFLNEYQNYLAYQKKQTAATDNSQEALKAISRLYEIHSQWYEQGTRLTDKTDEADQALIDYEAQKSELFDYAEDSLSFTLDEAMQEEATETPLLVKPALPVRVMLKNMQPNAEVSVSFWSEEEDYMKVLRETEKKKRYDIYLVLRENNGKEAAFYADVANLFNEQGDRITAVQILSNIAELQTGEVQVNRLLANHLLKLDRPDLALPLLEQLAVLEPDKPQAFRDLGLCYAALKQEQKAIEVLSQVLIRKWEQPIEGIQQIVLGEINHILSTSSQVLSIGSMPAEIRQPMPVDIRVLLEWDNPAHDMDLWLTDPQGEKAYYGNTLTQSGGKLTTQTNGGCYSPEEFIIREALQGEYKVQINHYGQKGVQLSAPVLVTVTIYKNYGRLNEQKQQITLRLTADKDLIDVVSFSMQPLTAATPGQLNRYQAITSEDPIYSVAFSPDNQMIAAVHDYDVKIYGTDNGQLRKTIHDVNVGGVVFKKMIFNRQGSLILLLGDSTLIPQESIKDVNSEDFWEDTWYEEGFISVVKLLDVQKGICLRTYVAPDTTLITEINFLADGKNFLAMTPKGAHKVNLATGIITPGVLRPKTEFVSFAVTPQFVVAAEKETVTVMDANHLKALRQLQIKTAGKLTISEDGKILSYVNQTGGKEQLTVLEVSTGKVLSSFDHFYQTGISKIGVVMLSPDGKYVASQPFGTNQVTVKATANASDIITYFHDGEITDLRFSPDGNFLTSAGKDNTIRTRSMNRLPFGSLRTEGNEFDFDLDTKGVLLAVAEENKISLFRRENRRENHFSQQILEHTTYAMPVHRATDVSLSTQKDQQLMLCIDQTSFQSRIMQVPFQNRHTDLQALLEDWTQNYPFRSPALLKVSRNGRYVAFDEDTLIKILDVKTLEKGSKGSKEQVTKLYRETSILTLKGHQPDRDKLHLDPSQQGMALLSMDFSRDGKLLVSRGLDKTIRVWEVASGKCLAIYTTRYDASSEVKFSASGDFILFEDAEYTIKLWDWKQQRTAGELRGHQGHISSIDVSRNGRYFVTAGADNTIRLWKARKTEAAEVFYDQSPRKVKFSNRNTFMSAGKDTYLKFWKFSR